MCTFCGAFIEKTIKIWQENNRGEYIPPHLLHCMLNEYLASDSDEHKATDEFGTGFEALSYCLAKIYADNGEEHSGETDNGNRAPY